MPRGDRTGPEGMGPMTGRAAGFCAGYNMPGYANPAMGRGCGMGRGGFGSSFGGGGRGWRNQFFATGQPGWMRFGGYPGTGAGVNPEQEKAVLKNQAEALQSEVDAIRNRLAELEAKGETSGQ